MKVDVSSKEIVLPVTDYDLDATLDSGQVFRWVKHLDTPSSWTGVVGKHGVRLTRVEQGIRAETAVPVDNWDWLREFLQTDADLAAILKTFPDDEPMRKAVAACHGLRVLRQDPWECLASFILSSTKQIVQIRQIVSQLCECFGDPLTLTLSPGEKEQLSAVLSISQDHPANTVADLTKNQRTILPLPREKGRGEGQWDIASTCSFPSAQRIAGLTETQLRSCKMGFRAPNLLATAKLIADGTFDLERLRHLKYDEALRELVTLPGVGKKIADCVLLFAYGFDSAFPVDVWIERALRELYFPKRRVSEKKLKHFAATHFGPHAGYAQQYLFHYMRTKAEGTPRKGHKGRKGKRNL